MLPSCKVQHDGPCADDRDDAASNSGMNSTAKRVPHRLARQDLRIDDYAFRPRHGFIIPPGEGGLAPDDETSLRDTGRDSQRRRYDRQRRSHRHLPPYDRTVGHVESRMNRLRAGLSVEDLSTRIHYA